MGLIYTCNGRRAVRLIKQQGLSGTGGAQIGC